MANFVSKVAPHGKRRIQKALSIVTGLFSSTGTVGQVRCAYENLGDIMVHRAIDSLMTGVNIVSYDDNDRIVRLVANVVGRRRIFRWGMLGGGTLIFSARSTGWLGTLESLLARSAPLCTFGTGVIDPEFVAGVYEAGGQQSPLDEESLQGWVRILRQFPMLGVRGVESARLLAEREVVGVEVVGDPAVAFARDEVKPKKRRKRIGINILTESYFWPGSKEHAIGEMEKFVRILIRDGWDVHLLPACPKDLALAIEFGDTVGREKVRIVSAFQEVEAYLAAVGALDLFVGMRLHSYIAACCVHTPGILVGYQPKCLDFTRTIGLERYHIPTDRVDAEQLFTVVADLYGSLDDVQQEIADKCRLMKQGLKAYAARAASRLNWQGAKR